MPSIKARKLPVAVSTGPSSTACAGATPNRTVSRSRQPRRSAGFNIGCMNPSPVDRISSSTASMPRPPDGHRKLSTAGGQ